MGAKDTHRGRIVGIRFSESLQRLTDAAAGSLGESRSEFVRVAVCCRLLVYAIDNPDLADEIRAIIPAAVITAAPELERLLSSAKPTGRRRRSAPAKPRRKKSS